MLARFICLGLLVAAPTAAQEPIDNTETTAERSNLEKRADQAVKVLTGELAADEVFAPLFLAAVSEAQLLAMAEQMSAQYGKLLAVQSLDPNGEFSGSFKLRFEKAIANGQIALDPAAPHKIVGLRILSFDTPDDTLDNVRADLEALPGEVSVLFAKLDDKNNAMMAINSDQQFAIGSTFKLYVLSALSRSIENGERSWSDVLTLDRKSFPSGRLQNWPDGAPLTLQTLATLMISISDNTATDLLMRELGREKVEAEVLAIGHSDIGRTLPFLTTFEMFALKGNPGNMAQYIAADEAGKRFMLADLEDDVSGNRDLIDPPNYIEPTAIDTVEWFASGRDLTKLGRRLADIRDPVARSIMAVSPSLPRSTVNEWSYVGYKGGSEPGVLNLTWLLRNEANDWYMLTMSWNNPDANVDHDALEALATRLIALAR